MNLPNKLWSVMQKCSLASALVRFQVLSFFIFWVAFLLLRIRSATKKQAFQGSGVKAPAFLRYAPELASPALPILATTKGSGKACARAHTLINEFSKKTRRDWATHNLLILATTKGSGKACARAHFLINEFSKENSQRLGNAQSPNPLPRPKGVARHARERTF